MKLFAGCLIFGGIGLGVPALYGHVDWLRPLVYVAGGAGIMSGLLLALLTASAVAGAIRRRLLTVPVQPRDGQPASAYVEPSAPSIGDEVEAWLRGDAA